MSPGSSHITQSQVQKSSWWRRYGWILVGLFFWFLAGVFWDYVDDDNRRWATELAEREASDRHPSVRLFAAKGLWWACLVNGAIAFFLGATSYWWCRLSPTPVSTEKARSSSTWFWIALIAIVLGSAWMRWERLELSFWKDEGWAMRLYVWGQFEEDAKGTLSFRERTWQETFWSNKLSNNHMLHSVLQRLTLEAWWKYSGNPRESFDEKIARIPAFLGGVVSIALMGLLGRYCGGSIQGISAALFFAIHPWHYRLTTEARGYSFLFVFTLLMLLSASILLRDRRWRWWILLGFSQFGVLYSFPGALHMVVLLHLVFGVYLWISRRESGMHPLWQWLVTNIISGGLYLLATLPSLLWLARFLAHKGEKVWIPTRQELLDFWGHFVAGIEWFQPSDGNPILITVETLATPYFLSVLLSVGVVLSAIGLGTMTQARHHFWRNLLMLTPLLGALLSVGQSIVTQRGLFPVYVVYGLVTVVLYTVLGIASAGQWLQERGRGRWCSQASALLITLFLGLYLWMVAPRLQRLYTLPLEPLREVAAATRWKHESKEKRDASQVVTASLWQRWPFYDYRLRKDIDSPKELRIAMEEARAQGQEFYFIVGNLPLASHQNRDVLAILRDESLFTFEGRWDGQYSNLTLLVYRLKK